MDNLCNILWNQLWYFCVKAAKILIREILTNHPCDIWEEKMKLVGFSSINSHKVEYYAMSMAVGKTS